MDETESRQQRAARVEEELAVARAIVAAELPGYALDADGGAATPPDEPVGAPPEAVPTAPSRPAEAAEPPVEAEGDAAAPWSPPIAAMKGHFAALFPDLPFDTGIGGDVHGEAAAMARDGTGIRIFTVRPIDGGPPEQIVVSLDDGRIVATSS